MPKPFYILKIVKTRKDHECICCSKIIPKGSYALRENGYNEYEKYFNNYFHLDKEHGCYKDYIDVQQPEDKILKMILEGARMVNE